MRAALIFVMVIGACLDVLGAYYVRQQHETLTRRVQDVSLRLITPPKLNPVAKLD